MVLVWHKNPDCCGYINEMGGIRVYGKRLSYPPRDIPFSLYRKHRSDLVLAPYTHHYFKEKMGIDMEPIAFTWKEVRYLPYKTLYMLSRSFKLGFQYGSTRRDLVNSIKYFLRHNA